MFKIDIRPGIVITILGFFGLVVILSESVGEIASKVPLSLFFIFIIIVGIVLEIYYDQKRDLIYGEFEGRRAGFA